MTSTVASPGQAGGRLAVVGSASGSRRDRDVCFAGRQGLSVVQLASAEYASSGVHVKPGDRCSCERVSGSSLYRLDLGCRSRQAEQQVGKGDPRLDCLDTFDVRLSREAWSARVNLCQACLRRPSIPLTTGGSWLRCRGRVSGSSAPSRVDGRCTFIGLLRLTGWCQRWAVATRVAERTSHGRSLRFRLADRLRAGGALFQRRWTASGVRVAERCRASTGEQRQRRRRLRFGWSLRAGSRIRAARRRGPRIPGLTPRLPEGSLRPA